jgi:hypothetical protein
VYYYLNKPEISEISETIINTDKVPFQSVSMKAFNKTFKDGDIDVKISARARYNISARILSKRKYVRGWESKLSPMDLVFGWGDAAKMEKINLLKIHQAVRWYSYKVSTDIPMTPQYIASHTSNHHIIPASENIRRALLFLRKYDIVLMKGYLVDIHGTKGNQNVSWMTSMTREDTGDGACEIFYVESLQIGNNVYK